MVHKRKNKTTEQKIKITNVKHKLHLFITRQCSQTGNLSQDNLFISLHWAGKKCIDEDFKAEYKLNIRPATVKHFEGVKRRK